MRLWRISNFTDLAGAGGILFPARWHSAGRPILYAAESPAGALLEILVHLDREDMPEDFQLIEIEVETAGAVETIVPETLPTTWRSDHAITRAIGDKWLKEARGLVLRVPSLLAPRTWNFLLDPQHGDASKMRIATTERFPFDGRFR
ncbi:MAG: RES family NAD+ phosphorylase [Methylocystis sp.]|nr:RES family NAD+ phosphorylase [Methylocystis sp.]